MASAKILFFLSVLQLETHSLVLVGMEAELLPMELCPVPLKLSGRRIVLPSAYQMHSGLGLCLNALCYVADFLIMNK